MTPAKVQEELDATVGQARAPRLEDRARMPYTNAVLHEIQRFISVLPLGLPRALIRDAHLRSHFLHKVHRNFALQEGDTECPLRDKGSVRPERTSNLGAPLPGFQYHLGGWGAVV